MVFFQLFFNFAAMLSFQNTLQCHNSILCSPKDVILIINHQPLDVTLRRCQADPECKLGSSYPATKREKQEDEEEREEQEGGEGEEEKEEERGTTHRLGTTGDARRGVKSPPRRVYTPNEATVTNTGMVFRMKLLNCKISDRKPFSRCCPLHTTLLPFNVTAAYLHNTLPPLLPLLFIILFLPSSYSSSSSTTSSSSSFLILFFYHCPFFIFLLSFSTFSSITSSSSFLFLFSFLYCAFPFFFFIFQTPILTCTYRYGVSHPNSKSTVM
ncbi:hypothetical protein C4D60_Mb08t32800 [Musa balbisiana]|uniref:Uncharacterized protein n=1 Tax=Musa balbisiana TaxID=52838 RepID=A0A4S8K8B1_MUSBA|nr:hypothetical protein C4D60_Mb08t32800 [Musa balbisiana]